MRAGYRSGLLWSAEIPPYHAYQHCGRASVCNAENRPVRVTLGRSRLGVTRMSSARDLPSSGSSLDQRFKGGTYMGYTSYAECHYGGDIKATRLLG